uniref:NADH dehydrogenase subunit 4 n=1 Tax=Pisidia serratifrons TaxID=761937 RepID=UPI00226C95A6|nr:NADH dehydrogenase subunit 4 [Pisidia serratifrons]UZA47088.1 NADH dehydrogenase subunit 4 [Pisidia serratifrons]
MLKVIFVLFSMMCFFKSWFFVQSMLFVLTFIFMVLWNHDFFICMVGYGLGLDYLSYILVLLSIWIVGLILISSMKFYFVDNFKFLFILVNLFLLLFLVLTFSCLSLILLYIFFEACLIPTVILILGWGYQPERIQAGVYMMFYTLFGSLPLLVSLMNLENWSGTGVFFLMNELIQINDYMYMFWFFSSVMAFIVKLPMYLFHIWLPKAHVEAPLAGSMILAGLLLKLGGYGLIRILPVFYKMSFFFCWLLVGLSILGGVVVSFICLRQIDMKSLIAYSSVAHMGLVLAGLMNFSVWGWNGALVVMVGHGLCSSGLFCLANMVYERVGSRSLLINKGLMNFMPSMALWWFLLSISNMGSPPSLNLLGEISLIMSVVSWSKLSMIGICLLSFFSACYTLYMYSLTQHGMFFSSLYCCCSGKVREFLVLMLHWYPLNLMFLKSDLFIFI